MATSLSLINQQATSEHTIIELSFFFLARSARSVRAAHKENPQNLRNLFMATQSEPLRFRHLPLCALAHKENPQNLRNLFMARARSEPLRFRHLQLHTHPPTYHQVRSVTFLQQSRSFLNYLIHNFIDKQLILYCIYPSIL